MSPLNYVVHISLACPVTCEDDEPCTAQEAEKIAIDSLRYFLQGYANDRPTIDIDSVEVVAQ